MGGSGGDAGGTVFNSAPCAEDLYPQIPEGAAGPYIYVSEKCGDVAVPDGTIKAPYKTIQQAIEAAKEGGVVLVMQGTYPGNLTIDKPISIIGANVDTPAELAGIIVQAPDPHAIVVKGVQGVTLRGLVIDKPRGAGIWVQSGGSAIIDGSSISGAMAEGGAEGYGVAATEDASIIVQRSIIVQSEGAGIHMVRSRGTVTQSRIEQNRGAGGIWVQKSAGYVSLSNNKILENERAGISLLSSRAIIVQNQIKDTKLVDGVKAGDGVIVAESFDASGSLGEAEVLLQGNAITGNGRAGVLVSGDARGIIVQNEVLNNGATAARGAGIWVQNNAGVASPIQIQHNAIQGNAWMGVGVASGARAIIVQNSGIGAVPAASFDDGGNTVICGEGVGVFGAFATIQDNKIFDNGRAGVFIDAALAGTAIIGNQFYDNDQFAIIVQNQVEPIQNLSNVLNGEATYTADDKSKPGHLVPHDDFGIE
jgi:parallel beta-helix repeat protein